MGSLKPAKRGLFPLHSMSFLNWTCAPCIDENAVITKNMLQKNFAQGDWQIYVRNGLGNQMRQTFQALHKEMEKKFLAVELPCACSVSNLVIDCLVHALAASVYQNAN